MRLKHRPLPTWHSAGWFTPAGATVCSDALNTFVANCRSEGRVKVSDSDQMGRFTVRPLTLALGWVTTAIMALAALAMLIV